MPRFMLFVRASADSEGLQLQHETANLKAMGIFNDTMRAAGIMETGEGLLPSSRDSRRIVFHNDSEPVVQEGPFPHRELIAGWWIIKVDTVEEAVEWAKKAPTFKEGNVIEVRRIAAMEDFGEAFTKELREKEEKLREELAKEK